MCIYGQRHKALERRETASKERLGRCVTHDEHIGLCVCMSVDVCVTEREREKERERERERERARDCEREGDRERERQRGGERRLAGAGRRKCDA